jgi:hypothetical protein
VSEAPTGGCSQVFVAVALLAAPVGCEMVRSWRRKGIVIIYILEASGWPWSRDGFAFFVGWIKGV